MNTSINQAIEQAGGQMAFARACGVTQAAVSKWARGQRVSAESAVAIERATNGALTRQMLRPDLWPSEPAAAIRREQAA